MHHFKLFTEAGAYPPYIQPAYVWLLKNLHNPYPSKQTRAMLSSQTSTPQKDVDSWFTDVRKRIGWNALRNEHFSTRKDMIAAATRFFKPSSMQLDTSTEPEYTAHFDQEFALLEDHAKNLYSRKFSTSTLAERLDAAQDIMPEINPAGRGNSLASRQDIGTIPDSPYSSPESFSPSPPTFSSLSPAPLPSQSSLQGRKRRQSTSESNPSVETRPRKRTRFVLLYFFLFLETELQSLESLSLWIPGHVLPCL